MKVDKLDNQIILYFEGNEDLVKLKKALEVIDIRGVPNCALSDLVDAVETMPKIPRGYTADVDSSGLVPEIKLGNYRAAITNMHRSWLCQKGRRGNYHE